MAAIDPGPTRPPAAGGIIPAEWPGQAADAIVDTIGKVRDRTTKPAIVAARGIVYGILAGVMGLVTMILLITALVRLWDVYVPGQVWIIYAIVAIVATIAGTIMLKRASAPSVGAD